MNKKTTNTFAVIIGILLIVVAVVYWTTPAGALPHFAPGYMAGSMKHHFKHGVAALFVGLAAFAFAWFNSAPSTNQ